MSLDNNHEDNEPDDIIKAQDVESCSADPESYEDHPRKLSFKTSFSSVLDCRKTFKEEGSCSDNEIKINNIEKHTALEKSPKGRFLRYGEELGSGAQKKVYIAYDTDQGREVAWNTINVSLMNDDSIAKIKEEIEIMKRLCHPNIISFISGFYNEDKKEVVIITELFSGGSLKQYLGNFLIPRLRVIKHWAIEILQGLKYLHELSPPIIHRDMKCDNIFVNKNNGKVKIGDLGFSCMLKTDYAKTFSGTVEFCSPEMYYGKYGVKADIYSFGMCILEMVTNELPYKECDGNIMTICDKATKQIHPLCIDKIKNIRLKNFIKDCLKAENDRPNASDLLQSEFLNDFNSDENNYPALGYPLQQQQNDIIKKTYSITEFDGNGSNNDLIIQLNDEKSNNMKIAHIVLRKKEKGKTMKINFEFKFDSDTIEGVVNELQKEIELAENEAKIVNTKLTIIINQLRQKELKSKEKDGEKKDLNVLFEKFEKKFGKCIKEAQDILSSFKNLKDLKQNEQEDYLNKMALLDQLIKMK